jgi:hypothetical protein
LTYLYFISILIRMNKSKDTLSWNYVEVSPDMGLLVKELCARADLEGFRSLWGKTKDGLYFGEVYCDTPSFDKLKDISFNIYNSFVSEGPTGKFLISDYREHLNSDLNDLMLQFRDKLATADGSESSDEDLDSATRYLYDEIKTLSQRGRLIIADQGGTKIYMKTIGRRKDKRKIDICGDRTGMLYFTTVSLDDLNYFQII